ncbi:MAG: hypothetical protein RMJ53_04965 [Chitinophagales bacterium]|nr:hypothetical protein [Chitinophagales bacterium]
MNNNRLSKILVVFIQLVLYLYVAFAQKQAKHQVSPAVQKPTIQKSDLRRLRQLEDSLKLLSYLTLNDSTDEGRKKACYTLIPTFVRALKIPNSFYYPFDSVVSVSKIYPPDSSFRIFTWQMQQGTGFRYYGFIQMKSSSLKFFPLVDKSDTMMHHTQSILNKNSWYGCLYYNILQHVVQKKKYYTLFGYERGDILTKRKILEVLHFDENKEPVFGAPFFIKIQGDSAQGLQADTFNRFFIEYKWKANPTMNYDKKHDLIIFDHLVPPNEKARDAYFTYVQDGTYEGFKWANTHWRWIEKVFTFSIDDPDNPPIPAPLFGTPRKQPELPK